MYQAPLELVRYPCLSLQAVGGRLPQNYHCAPSHLDQGPREANLSDLARRLLSSRQSSIRFRMKKSYSWDV